MPASTCTVRLAISCMGSGFPRRESAARCIATRSARGMDEPFQADHQLVQGSRAARARLLSAQGKPAAFLQFVLQFAAAVRFRRIGNIRCHKNCLHGRCDGQSESFIAVAGGTVAFTSPKARAREALSRQRRESLARAAASRAIDSGRVEREGNGLVQAPALHLRPSAGQPQNVLPRLPDPRGSTKFERARTVRGLWVSGDSSAHGRRLCCTFRPI